MAADVAQFYFRFRIGWRHLLQKVNVYKHTEYRQDNSIHGRDITISVLQKNKRPPYWNFSSGFDFDHITVIRIKFCIKFPNFIYIGSPTAVYEVLSNFQDGGRGSWILLPDSYLLMSLSSEGKSLSANQISSTYLNSRLTYNYFRFWKKHVLHIGILLPVSIPTISP